MTTNIGSADRMFRIIAGLGILSLFFVLQGDAHWYGLLGLIPLGTAMIRFCPAYRVLGMNTCQVGSKPAA